MSIRFPMRGKRIGRLVLLWRWRPDQVLSEGEAGSVQWRCLCACGRLCDIDESLFHSLPTPSCGCMKQIRRRITLRRRRTPQDVFWESRELARLLDVPWEPAWETPEDFVAEVGMPTWDQDLWPIEPEKGYVRDNVRWRNIDLMADRVRRMGLEEAIRSR